jgi:hypothetical protein
MRLLLICCIESNNLWLGGGGAPISDVINVLGIFNHHLMANKFSNHFIETHFSVPRIFMDQGNKICL